MEPGVAHLVDMGSHNRKRASVIYDRGFFRILRDSNYHHSGMSMDKKSKKRVEILRKREKKILIQLKGSKEQADDPVETKAFEDEIARLRAEIEELEK